MKNVNVIVERPPEDIVVDGDLIVGASGLPSITTVVFDKKCSSISVVPIDRVKLRLNCPLIDNENHLHFKQLTTQDGLPVGEWIRLNYIDGTSKIVGGIEHYDDLCQISSKQGYIYVAFSLPKLKTGGIDNVWPVTRAELPGLIHKLNLHVAEVGVVDLFDKATVINLELFSNASTKYPFDTYRPVFNTIDVSRTKCMIHPTSYTFKNTQRSFKVYDKRAEQPEGVRQHLPEHQLRAELTLKNSEVVEAFCGVKSWSQVNASLDPITDKFKSYLQHLFRAGPSGQQMVQANSRSVLSHERIPDVFSVEGGIAILHRLGSISNVRYELQQQGKPSWKIRRLVKKLQQYSEMADQIGEVSINELKQELYSKLIEGLEEGVCNS